MSSDSSSRELSLDATRSLARTLPSSQIASLGKRFAQAWLAGRRPLIEDYMNQVPAPEQITLLRILLSFEISSRQQSGESPRLEHYLTRFPDHVATVTQAFLQTDNAAGTDSTVDLARSLGPFEQNLQSSLTATDFSHTAAMRYHKLRKLGAGAFGTVWLAEDLELKRQVALKEPRADRLQNAADIETYLAEARVLASLDHPHIVPVYDVGRTIEGSCYVVSKLIDGTDLAAYTKQKSVSFTEAASLVAQVAEALQHTHNRGLVHRDIKPANILIDGHDRPYLTDFGLALRDEDFGKQEAIAGTPAYMSPEQARGESHLVDGRSDVFSLGVVLYELLTGRKPFRGEDWRATLQQIVTLEPKPLRQLNEAIPKELERICLKALSKRATDRYTCAADLGEDLRNWSRPTADRTSIAPAKIVPKGLRSFDAADSEFFLQLLPGPRDRDGLPESLRFWKSRIEETDSEKTFRVGLVYGPSGCGKSSLMKAGLLPRLSDHVIRVFLEATPDQTEQQLFHGLRRACPDLPRDASLVDTLAAIRRGKGIPAGRKVLLVVDQFEQWLHNHGAETNSALAAGLRQCDGGRVQAVLMVRDDFWMPISEFLRSLEVRLIEGHNANAVSLFDPLHARKVLAEFGKAYGRLPENLGEISHDQDLFLTQSVTGLSQDGRVITVRLALFSDMMKSRPWTLASLAEVGGTTGVGATFLEENFSSRTAPPRHRRHQEAARAVLRALLPTTGTDIKGHRRSASELQVACGYVNRPQDFAELIRILDSDVRLITLVGPEGVVGYGWAGGDRSKATESGDSKLSVAGGLATGDPAGGKLLPGDDGSSAVIAVASVQTNPEGGCISAGLHRRGTGTGTQQGVSEAPEQLQRIAEGSGNSRSASSESGIDTTITIGAAAGTSRPHPPDAQRSLQLPPERTMARSTHHPSPETPSTHYQLTHDYLVPSLRDWLTRKQRETRRGRAELLLEERAATWNAKPEPRFLPSVWEYLNIWALTKQQNWSTGERAMMSKAIRVHAVRSTLATVAMIGLLAVGLAIRSNVTRQQELTRIEGLVGRLVDADPSQIPEIAALLSQTQQVSDPKLAPLLTPAIESTKPINAEQKRAQIHARMAAVARDPSLVDPLLEELLTSKVTYIAPIRELLKPYASHVSDECWSLLADETADSERRFRAALVLADYAEAADSSSWSDSHLTFVARHLVSSNAEYQPILRNLLRPIRAHLLPDLKRAFADRAATDAQRLSAANAFADYFADDIGKLASLLAVATPEQFVVIYPLVAVNPTPAAIDDLAQITATLPPDDLGSVPRIEYGQRRANAAVTLLRLGEREKVLPVFGWSDDPEALTQFIFRCKPRGIKVELLMDLLDLVAASVDRYPRDTRYALMLAIGEFAPSEIPQARRAGLVNRLADWYANDPSSGVHGAAGWLLRHLGEKQIADRVDQTPVPYSPEREWFTLAITVNATPTSEPNLWKLEEAEASTTKSEEIDPNQTKSKEPEPRPKSLPSKTLYYTFIVQPDGEYTISSVEDEVDRANSNEVRHTVKLTRPYALLDREITFEELIAFSPVYTGFMKRFDAVTSDAGFGARWYDSVEFCRWLGQEMGLKENDQCYADPKTLDKERYPRDSEDSTVPKNWPVDLSKRGFRLPTESEWEVMARSGSRTSYGFGSEVALLDRFGWFTENSGIKVHPVREKRPSIRGLFDLHGNLFEWTHDWNGDFGESGQPDPLGAKNGRDRVLRSGSFGNIASICRTAFRNIDYPANRRPDSGFRLALSLPSQEIAKPGKETDGAEAIPEEATPKQRPDFR